MMRIPVLWVVACATPLASLGCGEVENCREGEEGCLKGLPLRSGERLYDLVFDPITEVCVAPSGGDDGVSSICEIPGGPVATKESLPRCRAAGMTFGDAAVAWCKQSCARRAALCGEPCDPEQACG